MFQKSIEMVLIINESYDMIQFYELLKIIIIQFISLAFEVN